MATRISGLASGMDIDTMVKNLMSAQRAPLDALTQKKTQLEWKKTDYTTMYTKLRDFRNKTFDFKLSGSLSPMKATSTSEAVATASATGDAATVGHELIVTKLAKGASVTTGALGSAADKTSLATQLAGAAGALPADPSTTFTVNINGTDVTVDKTKSVYEFISAVNKADVGVKAAYDATLDRVFFNSTTSGASAKVDFSANTVGTDGYNFLKNGLKLADDGAKITAGATGQNAAFTLDGVGLEQTSNTFTIAGVSYTLKAEGTTTVGVATDIDQTVENVKAFIKEYNSMLEAVNTEVKETRYKDFLPLTSEQRADMSEDDIKLWEEKAKSGMLRNDSILSNLVSGMRNNFADPVSGVAGKYNSAASIGITTGDYSENGKLYLDEAKLKKALQEDPDAVSQIFGSSGDTTSEDGIANRLYDTLKTAMDKIDAKAGVVRGSADTQSTMYKELKDYNTRIDTLTDRLADLEDRYYKQFDAMETALNQLNSQATWLQQQMGTSS